MVWHDLRKNDIQPTGAIMTFDEWFDENKNYLDGLSEEAALRCAWGDATAAERERWGRVIEGKERDTPRRETAAEIRRKTG